jgi:hypothetical protein
MKDRRFTVYIPKTKEASLIFDEFVGWCTTKNRGDMFNTYVNGKKYLRPNGDKSNLYIIIDNRFFNGNLKSDYLFQIHFESSQIKDRIQSENSYKSFKDLIDNNENLSNFFYKEITNIAKSNNSYKKTNNVYIEFLIKFGWTEALFELIEDYTPIIRFVNKDITKLPDISRFKNLTTLIIKDAKLTDLHHSIGDVDNLQELLLPNNKITSIPKEIGKLKNLLFINLMGNKITNIPDEIRFLDKTNGGNLHRIAINPKEIGEINFKKLKELLPSVIF